MRRGVRGCFNTRTRAFTPMTFSETSWLPHWVELHMSPVSVPAVFSNLFQEILCCQVSSAAFELLFLISTERMLQTRNPESLKFPVLPPQVPRTPARKEIRPDTASSLPPRHNSISRLLLRYILCPFPRLFPSLYSSFLTTHCASCFNHFHLRSCI